MLHTSLTCDRAFFFRRNLFSEERESRRSGDIGREGMIAGYNYTSLVAHTAGAYSSFRCMERLGVCLLHLDGLLVHQRLPPSISLLLVGTHLYSWVERSIVKVKCLAQEYNTMTQPGIEPRPFGPESSAVTTRSRRLATISCFVPPLQCIRVA